MSKKRIRILCAAAVRSWGIDAQLAMLIEECAELTFAICKFWRKGPQSDHSDIEEEIADVEIMCMQAREIFGDDKIDRIKAEKLDRLEKRLKKYE